MRGSSGRNAYPMLPFPCVDLVAKDRQHFVDSERLRPPECGMPMTRVHRLKDQCAPGTSASAPSHTGQRFMGVRSNRPLAANRLSPMSALDGTRSGRHLNLVQAPRWLFLI